MLIGSNKIYIVVFVACKTLIMYAKENKSWSNLGSQQIQIWYVSRSSNVFKVFNEKIVMIKLNFDINLCPAFKNSRRKALI